MDGTIAIVGNGEAGHGAGPLIDAADLVIRFNGCHSHGRAGTRTDVVAVCNTGRPAAEMLGTPAWALHPAVTSASEIWSVRDPEKFAALRPLLAVSHSELNDFCDDYTQGFNAFCARAGKTHRVIGAAVHDAVDAALSVFRPTPYVVPSSGMIVIAEVVERFPGCRVTLAGFGHSGWQGHPFAAERELVETYIAAGHIERLVFAPFISTLEGAA